MQIVPRVERNGTRRITRLELVGDLPPILPNLPDGIEEIFEKVQVPNDGHERTHPLAFKGVTRLCRVIDDSEDGKPRFALYAVRAHDVLGSISYPLQIEVLSKQDVDLITGHIEQVRTLITILLSTYCHDLKSPLGRFTFMREYLDEELFTSEERAVATDLELNFIKAIRELEELQEELTEKQFPLDTDWLVPGYLATSQEYLQAYRVALIGHLAALVTKVEEALMLIQQCDIYTKAVGLIPESEGDNQDVLRIGTTSVSLISERLEAFKNFLDAMLVDSREGRPLSIVIDWIEKVIAKYPTQVFNLYNEVEEQLLVSSLAVLPISEVIMNAERYGLKNEIGIDVYIGDKSLIFSVADCGLGMSTSDVKRIFEREYRAHSAQALTPAGTGNGMANVLEIVNFIGGDIHIESVELLPKVVAKLESFRNIFAFEMEDIDALAIEVIQAFKQVKNPSRLAVAEPQEVQGILLPADFLDGLESGTTVKISVPYAISEFEA